MSSMLKQWFSKKKIEEHPRFWQQYQSQFDQKPPKEITDVTFVVFDTETTGFSFENDRILSIGAIRLQRGRLQVSQMLELYVQQAHFDSESVPIHGLLKKGKREMILENEALIQFLGYIGNAILVAHHAHFDIGMINTALKRHGLPHLKNKVLDTSDLYKRTLLRSPLLIKHEQYSLDEIAQKFDISQKDRHTALGDAYITAIGFLKIIERLKLTQLKELFKSGLHHF